MLARRSLEISVIKKEFEGCFMIIKLLGETGRFSERSSDKSPNGIVHANSSQCVYHSSMHWLRKTSISPAFQVGTFGSNFLNFLYIFFNKHAVISQSTNMVSIIMIAVPTMFCSVTIIYCTIVIRSGGF